VYYDLGANPGAFSQATKLRFPPAVACDRAKQADWRGIEDKKPEFDGGRQHELAGRPGASFD
jgi:hypothetical protein